MQRLIDAWRNDGRTDLAAVQAWEGGLWQTIDIRPQLGRVRCPTLLLVGRLDLICGPAHSETIARGMRHAQVVTIPDSGHFIPAEASESFRDAVASFCAAHPVAPAARS